ncbi:methyltransferase [Tepidibacter mesophilus]|uniref:methyltransferase n=1 Tax=Tepidibacter mesophilus TaxID=655607 RepID=UPI000C06EBED|nr:methyltransferase [Tepidibacter mesophilus]
MKEQYYENLLNIKTTGHQKWDKNVVHYHPYEATLYSALEILFQQYQVKSYDNIVDFGCGKGRLAFYINHFYKSNVTGIEMNEDIYIEAINNKNSYLKKHRNNKNEIKFLCCFAQEYDIKPIDNKFYFFNPFSIQIFRKIINNILQSVEEYERIVELILYYPSDDYIYYLENNTSFALIDEIIMDKLYNCDNNERFLIYRF